MFISIQREKKLIFLDLVNLKACINVAICFKTVNYKNKLLELITPSLFLSNFPIQSSTINSRS